MRFVIKSDNDRTPRLASDDTRDALSLIVDTQNTALINDAIYRDAYDTPDGKRSRVEDQLAIAYKNKCAYCERICKADIEHYRPKKGVVNDATHLGYYWLCYEWSNLIPSCITCNREGAKHNQFPIIGPRVTAPSLLPNGDLNLDLCRAQRSPLLDEIPYLLHPEIDHPEDFFEFIIDPDGEGIRIAGIDVSNRGAQTIAICLLNRIELKLDRVAWVIDEFKESVHSLFIKLQTGQSDQAQFKIELLHFIELLHTRSRLEEKTHTYLRKFIVASHVNFNNIVLPFIGSNARQIVSEAFKFYKQL
jgi:hypothetical protein